MKFEDRAVAFIDVLGFKALVEGAVNSKEQLNQLSQLIDLLSSAVPTLDSSVDPSVSTHLIPKHVYISDCIILSAPLADMDRPGYDGLSVIVMRAIQLSHFFLNAGYLIRGGISIGKVWHTGANIVGPAYQEAFLLEQCCRDPIVVLSDSAAEKWQGGSRMCLKDDGRVFVNGVHDYYVSDSQEYGGVERAYKNYAGLADQRLAEGLPESAHSKWVWFKRFLESEALDGFKWAQA